jgi:hypothetical protein
MMAAARAPDGAVRSRWSRITRARARREMPIAPLYDSRRMGLPGRAGMLNGVLTSSLDPDR